MQRTDITDFITTLRHLESKLNTLTVATGTMPQPAEYAARAELATYVRELNLTAAAWQSQSEALMQLLSDHPGLVESVPLAGVNPPLPALAALYDIKYRRLGLDANWERQQPQAFMHAGMVVDLPRKSFREVYRRVLAQFAREQGPELIAACRRASVTIPLTTDRDVYHHATAEHHGYIFNIQLPADKIRTYISALYEVFTVPQSQFGVWV